MLSCKKLKDPVFNGIENVRLGKVGFGSSQLTLDMKCFNPNNTKAVLKEAEGDAWMDSSYLGHFRVDTAVNIPANSDFTVPVKMDVDTRYILKNSLFAFMNDEVTIRISGEARVGKSGIYKRFPIAYVGKQNISQAFR